MATKDYFHRQCHGEARNPRGARRQLSDARTAAKKQQASQQAEVALSVRGMFAQSDRIFNRGFGGIMRRAAGRRS